MFERHRLYFQNRLDGEWDEKEHTAALLRAQRDFRKQNPISFWNLLKTEREDAANRGDLNNLFVEEGLN
ncbi:hypothetical protein L596_020167 [Steinernema carpocapsae]|uniref:Uncharacterized protein n=1 Tax=Steinernema carpocapsae TaxID=34508 RepID=A0A4U5MTJ0_STECR|nr:hypothetical protein L596_020167 [Steinernema carpocapsae]